MDPYLNTILTCCKIPYLQWKCVIDKAISSFWVGFGWYGNLLDNQQYRVTNMFFKDVIFSVRGFCRLSQCVQQWLIHHIVTPSYYLKSVQLNLSHVLRPNISLDTNTLRYIRYYYTELMGYVVDDKTICRWFIYVLF